MKLIKKYRQYVSAIVPGLIIGLFTVPIHGMMIQPSIQQKAKVQKLMAKKYPQITQTTSLSVKEEENNEEFDPKVVIDQSIEEAQKVKRLKDLTQVKWKLRESENSLSDKWVQTEDKLIPIPEKYTKYMLIFLMGIGTKDNPIPVSLNSTELLLLLDTFDRFNIAHNNRISMFDNQKFAKYRKELQEQNKLLQLEKAVEEMGAAAFISALYPADSSRLIQNNMIYPVYYYLMNQVLGPDFNAAKEFNNIYSALVRQKAEDLKHSLGSVNRLRYLKVPHEQQTYDLFNKNGDSALRVSIKKGSAGATFSLLLRNSRYYQFTQLCADIPVEFYSSPEYFPIAFEPLQGLIAVGVGNDIKVFTDIGTNIKTYTGHNAPVTSVAWHPNGKYLISTSAEGKRNLIVWDIEDQNHRMMSINSEKKAYGNKAVFINSYSAQILAVIGGVFYVMKFQKDTDGRLYCEKKDTKELANVDKNQLVKLDFNPSSLRYSISWNNGKKNAVFNIRTGNSILEYDALFTSITTFNSLGLYIVLDIAPDTTQTLRFFNAQRGDLIKKVAIDNKYQGESFNNVLLTTEDDFKLLIGCTDNSITEVPILTQKALGIMQGSKLSETFLNNMREGTYKTEAYFLLKQLYLIKQGSKRVSKNTIENIDRELTGMFGANSRTLRLIKAYLWPETLQDDSSVSTQQSTQLPSAQNNNAWWSAVQKWWPKSIWPSSRK